jgi:hypothetical protein
MFYHAFDAYMQYAFPQDELKPLSCSGHNTLGKHVPDFHPVLIDILFCSYALTLIDALDMLLVRLCDSMSLSETMIDLWRLRPIQGIITITQGKSHI